MVAVHLQSHSVWIIIIISWQSTIRITVNYPWYRSTLNSEKKQFIISCYSSYYSHLRFTNLHPVIVFNNQLVVFASVHIIFYLNLIKAFSPFFNFKEAKLLVIGRTFPFLVSKVEYEGTLIQNVFSTFAVIVNVSIILLTHFASIVAPPRTRKPLKEPVCHTSGSAGSNSIQIQCCI